MSEVSLKAFVESTWFKGLARAAMIVVAAGAGYVGALLTNINARTQALESSVVDVREAQAVRAQDNENFQAYTVKSFTDLDVDMAGVRTSLSGMNAKLGEISGILQQMQRSEVARLRYHEGAL